MNEVKRRTASNRWVCSPALAAMLLAGMIASACGGGTAGVQTPAASAVTPVPTSPHTDVPNPKLTVVSGLAPSQAADLIARAVTQSHPLLFPNSMPSTWSVEVSDFVDANSFSARFTSPDRAKSITLALVAANPREPDSSTVQSNPNFRGDERSAYQVQDSNDPVSFRWLLWSEPGGWGGHPAGTAAPYYLDATGLTDAEFWEVANSLRPIQR
jgi:hypothetical protein